MDRLLSLLIVLLILLTLTSAQPVPTNTLNTGLIPVLTLGSTDNIYTGDASPIDVGQHTFNDLFHNSPYHILKRECIDCTSPFHKEMYYKRITNLNTFDLYSQMSVWTSINNTLGVDFNLYSTLQDALTDATPWTHCNYDDIRVGAFRDCGPTGIVAINWVSDASSSLTSARTAKFSVLTNATLELATQCILGTNYFVVGQPCIVSGDPHFVIWNGNKHDFQGQPTVNFSGVFKEQYYYMYPCAGSSFTDMPFAISGRHYHWNGLPVTGLDYITIELYDDNGDVHFLWFSSSLHHWVTNGPTTLFDAYNSSELNELSNLTTILGQTNKFRVTYTQSSDKRIDVLLEIGNKGCSVQLFMYAQTNFVDNRYRMHYLQIAPPFCYKCHSCGLCGDFKRASSGDTYEDLETCGGGMAQYRDGWSADITEAYDCNAYGWEKGYVGEFCSQEGASPLNGTYTPFIGPDFVYVPPCDLVIESTVISACQNARDALSGCCAAIGGDYCDEMQSFCELDVCAASGTDIFAIPGNVQSLFTEPLLLVCDIPNVGDQFDPIVLELVTMSPTAPSSEPTAIPTIEPTNAPTIISTAIPTEEPTVIPTINPTVVPTTVPNAVSSAKAVIPIPPETTITSDDPTRNNCEDSGSIKHINWDHLANAQYMKDNHGEMPRHSFNLKFNLQTYELNIDCDLEYLGYSTDAYLLQGEYSLGTTYVIGFDSFDPTNNVINEPSTCSNRLKTSFNYNKMHDFNSFWTYSEYPYLSGHIGSEDRYLSYPKPSPFWTLSIDRHECTQIHYSAVFSWNELTNCKDWNGKKLIRVKDNGSEIRLSGTFYVNIVSPFSMAPMDTGYYRVYPLIQQDFDVSITKQINVLSTTGTELFIISILSVFEDVMDDSFKMFIFTQSADYLSLSDAFILNTPFDNITITPITAQKQCIASSEYTCGQLFEVCIPPSEFINCPPADLRGEYEFGFKVKCMKSEFQHTCDAFMDENNGSSIALSVESTFVDRTCDLLLYES
eukprot:895219_1